MERITEYFEQIFQSMQEHSWVIHEDSTFRQIDELEGYYHPI